MFTNIALKVLAVMLKLRLSKLLVFIFARFVYDYENNKDNGNQKNILILNSERYDHDLIALSKDERARLLIFPSRIQTLINSIFLNRNKTYKIDKYIHPEKDVQDLVKFISNLVLFLNKKYHLSGIMTCSFYYRQDFPFQSSSLQTKIPYYVLFKEYMKDDCIVSLNIERYHDRGYKFFGKKIFAANNNIKDILIEAEVCDEDQISIVGSPRFDRIFHAPSTRYNENKTIVTLFSFLHSSGGLQLKNLINEGNFFSNKQDVGFFRLFEQVHEAFAELAIENPDILFYVKTKWAGTWFDRIKSTIQGNVGLDIKDLPNLILDSEEDAQSLIERSSIVVAFNSTTVLETGLMGKKFILPIFCEAKEKYYNSNVFFREFLELLPTASSKEDLKNKIISFKSDDYKNKIPEDMINKFIYAFDGKSGERILNEI